MKVKYMAMTGIMAAMITIMTAYVCHVPVGMNGGYIHFGDAVIYLAAVLLPKPYAIAAAANGGGLADLFTAPVWVPATVLIKTLLVLQIETKGVKIITKRNVMSTIIAYFISGIGYYAAEKILFEEGAVFAVTMGQTLIQSLGSAVIFILLGLAMDKAHVKNRFMS